MSTFIFLAMIFCHILDDYTLQGWLANAKQREWWQKNAPDLKYKFDYIMALAMHSMSWSFMIMLPIALYLKFEVSVIFVLLFVINSVVHGAIDDLKANKKVINLCQDQTAHIIQIIMSFLIFKLYL